MSLKIRRDDEVIVISGKDNGNCKDNGNNDNIGNNKDYGNHMGRRGTLLRGVFGMVGACGFV